MAKQFWYQVMGETIGPVTGTELRNRALAGEVKPDTPVRVCVDGKWVSASRLKNLFDSKGHPIRDERIGPPMQTAVREDYAGPSELDRRWSQGIPTPPASNAEPKTISEDEICHLIGPPPQKPETEDQPLAEPSDQKPLTAEVVEKPTQPLAPSEPAPRPVKVRSGSSLLVTFGRSLLVTLGIMFIVVFVFCVVVALLIFVGSSPEGPTPASQQELDELLDELLANVDAAIRIEAGASQLAVRNTLEAQGGTWDPSTSTSYMDFDFEEHGRSLTVCFERAEQPGQKWAFICTLDGTHRLTPHDAFNIYDALNARLTEKFGKPYDKHEEVLSPFRPDEREEAVMENKVQYFAKYRAGSGYLHISISEPLIPEEPIEGVTIRVEYSYKRPGS